jgi:hypothetical protein
MKYYYRLISTILMLSVCLAPLASSQDKPDPAFSYGVVYSSEQDIKKANNETDQLPQIFPQYQKENYLFKRRNWYASVVLFKSKTDADEARNIIDGEYSRGSFVVNLQEWCRPDWRKNTGVELGVSYYDCKRGEIMDGGPGAIIISAQLDSPQKAQDKIEILKDKFKKLQHNLAIFKKGKYFYPAVINYKNTQEANQQIPQVPQEMKNKAKAVNINQWCPRRELKPVEDPKIYDYIECK